MLVVEKIFGISLKDDPKTEDLCQALANCNCYDKENYKLDNSVKCCDCKFYKKDGKCNSRIYEWLISEYKESEANNERKRD